MGPINYKALTTQQLAIQKKLEELSLKFDNRDKLTSEIFNSVNMLSTLFSTEIVKYFSDVNDNITSLTDNMKGYIKEQSKGSSNKSEISSVVGGPISTEKGMSVVEVKDFNILLDIVKNLQSTNDVVSKPSVSPLKGPRLVQVMGLDSINTTINDFKSDMLDMIDNKSKEPIIIENKKNDDKEEKMSSDDVKPKKTKTLSVELIGMDELVNSVVSISNNLAKSSVVNAMAILSTTGFIENANGLTSLLTVDAERAFPKIAQLSLVKNLKGTKQKASSEESSTTNAVKGDKSSMMNEIKSASKDFKQSIKDLTNFYLFTKAFRFVMKAMLNDFSAIISDIDKFTQQNYSNVAGDILKKGKYSEDDIKSIPPTVIEGLGKLGTVFKIVGLLTSFDTSKMSIKGLLLFATFTKMLGKMMPQLVSTLSISINQFDKVGEPAVNKFNNIMTGTIKSIIGAITDLSNLGISKLLKTRLTFGTFLNIVDSLVLLSSKFSTMPEAKDGHLKVIEVFSKSLTKMAQGVMILGIIPKFITKHALSTIDLMATSLMQLSLKLTSMKQTSKGELESVRTLEFSFKNIARSIIMLALVAPIVPIAMVSLALIGFASKIFDKIGEGIKNMEKAGQALTYMGKGLIVFALAATGFTLLMSRLGGDFAKGLLFLGLASGLFTIIGLGAKYIDKGAKAVLWMSLGMMAFSIGVAFMSIVLLTANPMTVLLGFATLAVSAILFGLMGKFWKEIALGALATMAMGIGLFLFSLGLTPIAKALENFTWEKMAMMGLLIGGTALVFGVMGTYAAPIALGAAVAALMGLALIPLSKGMMELAKVKPPTLEEIGYLGQFLGSIVLAFSAMGAASLLLIPGSITAGLMGIGLKSLTEGLKSASEFNWTKFPINDVKNVIIGISEAFAGVSAGGKTGMGGILGGVMTGLGLSKNKVKDGIKSVLGAAEALREVATGLQDFSTKTQGLDLSGTYIDGSWKPNAGSLGERISVALGVINSSFAAIGATGNSGTSVMKLLLGNDFKKSDVEVGIDSVLKSGKALTSVAEGLMNFNNLTMSLDLGGTESGGIWKPNVGSLGEKISVALGVLNSSFSAIGASGNSGTSVMKILLGNDFKKSDVEVGIDSVLKSGKALTSVAEGLQKFNQMTQELNLSGELVGGVWKPMAGSLGERISIALGVVNSAFAAIGSSGNSGTSVMKILLGNDFKKSDTEVGINSVMNAGKALQSVAQGLMQFETLTKSLNLDESQDSPGNLVSTPGKIRSVLTMVNQVFAAIGKAQQGQPDLLQSLIGTSFGKNDVETGIASVKDIGVVLEGIAKGLEKWAKLDTKTLPLDLIKNNVASVITVLSKAFADIGNQGGAAEPSFLDSILGGGDIDKDLIRGNPVARGIASVKGLGDELGKIADAVNKWSDLSKVGIASNSFDPASKGSIAYNIKTVLSLIKDVFADIGKQPDSQLDFTKMNSMSFTPKNDVEMGVKAVKGVGQELKNIADGVKTFSDIKTGKGLNIEMIASNIRVILTVIKDVFAEIGKEGTDELVKKGIDAVRGSGDELKKISESLQPYMDLQKGVETSKGKRVPINIEQLKSNIKDLVLLNIDILAAVGGDQNRWSEIMSSGIGNPPNIDNIMQGKDILKEVAEGLKPLTGLVESISKIDAKKWESQKKILKDLALSPVESIKAVSDAVEGIGTEKINLVINQILPQVNNQITQLVDLYNNINQKIGKDKKTFDISSYGKNIVKFVKELMVLNESSDTINNVFSVILPKIRGEANNLSEIETRLNSQLSSNMAKNMGPFQFMAKDIMSFIDLSKSLTKATETTSGLDNFLKTIEKYAAVVDPFSRFVALNKEYVSDTQKLINAINTIKLEPIREITKLNQIVLDIIKNDVTVTANNLKSVKELLFGNKGQETTQQQEANEQKLKEELKQKEKLEDRAYEQKIYEERRKLRLKDREEDLKRKTEYDNNTMLLFTTMVEKLDEIISLQTA